MSAAVAAEPENRAYRDSLGWVFYRLGRFPEAVAELEKAVDEKQPDGTVLDHLGDAYEKLGRHEPGRWRPGSGRTRPWKRKKKPEKAEKVREKMTKSK